MKVEVRVLRKGDFSFSTIVTEKVPKNFSQIRAMSEELYYGSQMEVRYQVAELALTSHESGLGGCQEMKADDSRWRIFGSRPSWFGN
jgi:hypothetical protein